MSMVSILEVPGKVSLFQALEENVPGGERRA